MSPETAGIVGVALLLLFMYLRMWIGLAMLLVGFWGLVYIMGLNTALAVLATVPYRNIADYPITAIPMFVFMGAIVSTMGVGKDLYQAAHKWIGHLRGGLAMATIAACGGFAAITGHSGAAVATMGKVATPEMTKYRYDERLSSGSITAGGTLGILIPPSMGFILYGILTGVSIGHLFMAGIIPGVLQVVFYVITIFIVCRLNPILGPPGPKTSFKEKIVSLRYTGSTVLLFLVVILGIYLGIFTPTEAAAVGTFGAIVITAIGGRVNLKRFVDSSLEAGRITAMIVLMIAGAFVFANFIALSKLPFDLGNFVSGLESSRYLVLITIMIIYIFLGMFLDVLACVILTLPIFFPVIQAMGFNPIWYGVLTVRIIEIGLITPPVGLNVFMLSGVTGTNVGIIFRGVIPFLIADVFHLALLIMVPQISLWIPSHM